MSSTEAKIDFSEIDEILKQYDYQKSNLIAVLQATQALYNYLPKEAMIYIGTKLGVSPATVFGVATFYAQFSLEPKGKYIIKCCDGTACHVRGSKPVYEAIKQRFKLTGNKTTTDDGLLTVEVVNCLGACSIAPVVVINGKVYPEMTTDAINIILDAFLKENEGV